MIATVRFGTLVGLLVFCGACGEQTSTAPTPAARLGPPLSGPSTTYHFSAPLDRPLVVDSYTPTSKYVLYNNGAFSLRYDEARAGGPYTGSYRQEDGRILFDFGADGKGPTPGEPDGLGTLNGDFLEVRYNFWLRVGGGDWEDAVYQRTE